MRFWYWILQPITPLSCRPAAEAATFAALIEIRSLVCLVAALPDWPCYQSALWYPILVARNLDPVTAITPDLAQSVQADLIATFLRPYAVFPSGPQLFIRFYGLYARGLICDRSIPDTQELELCWRTAAPKSLMYGRIPHGAPPLSEIWVPPARLGLSFIGRMERPVLWPGVRYNKTLFYFRFISG